MENSMQAAVLDYKLELAELFKIIESLKLLCKKSKKEAKALDEENKVTSKK